MREDRTPRQLEHRRAALEHVVAHATALRTVLHDLRRSALDTAAFDVATSTYEFHRAQLTQWIYGKAVHEYYEDDYNAQFHLCIGLEYAERGSALIDELRELARSLADAQHEAAQDADSVELSYLRIDSLGDHNVLFDEVEVVLRRFDDYCLATELLNEGD
ncbi:hypothetical protein [Lentzea sp. E54]|uniref:hypothetical protein n=1 Tax=Lentzea xerophila TaxID=3435883 RepID=UPI003DA6A59A